MGLVTVLVSVPGIVPAVADDAGETMAPGPGDLLLVRVAPALVPGSADLIDLVALREVSLHGVALADGEGALRLEGGTLAEGQVLRLVSDQGVPVGGPWGLAPASAAVPAVTLVWGDEVDAVSSTGRFALAKGGDTLTLRYEGQVLDAFVYGDAVLVDDAPDAGQAWNGSATERSRIDGRIYQRAWADGAWVDRDGADEWSHTRVYRQEQSDRAAVAFNADRVRAFVCPDHCYTEVVARIDAASSSILLNMYDLSLKEAVEALAAAAERGVAVRVLLEPKPVAASSDKLDRIAWSVQTLQDAGVDVRLHGGGRFAVNHAKYLVVDDAWTVVLSENANLHGWSPSNRDGNRGWGLAVQDEQMAAWFRELFIADADHPTDAAPYVLSAHLPDRGAPSWGGLGAAASPRLEVLDIMGPVQVTPVLAPDHLGIPATNPILAAVAGARSDVRLQQLNLPLDWSRNGRSMDSPLAAALLDRVEVGVEVTGTLAGAFEDGDVFTDGNDRTAAVLTDAGADVRLGGAPDPGGLVHNKGWVVDVGPDGRNAVVVGSANGNLASQALNREVDLLVEDARVAAYFAAVLDEDLQAASLAPSRLGEEAPADPTVAVPALGIQALLVLLALVGVAALGRPRR